MQIDDGKGVAVDHYNAMKSIQRPTRPFMAVQLIVQKTCISGHSKMIQSDTALPSGDGELHQTNFS